MKTKLKRSIVALLLIFSVLMSFMLISCSREDEEDEEDDFFVSDEDLEGDDDADNDSDKENGQIQEDKDNVKEEDDGEKQPPESGEEDDGATSTNPDNSVNNTEDDIESGVGNDNENLEEDAGSSDPSEDASSDSDSAEDDPGNSGAQNGSEGTDNGSSSAPVINQTVINNNITISGTGADVSYASAMGLRSAVSIICEFTTTKAGSFFNPTPTTETYLAGGAGVIYSLDDDGNAFVITNYHVVYGESSDSANHISDNIKLFIYGMESEDCAIPAKYVGGSANYDIAILRVEGNDILKSAKKSGSATAVTVANSDSLAPGHTTVAIGFPSMGGMSVTSGIVSVASEYITMTAVDNSGEVSFRVIRTDTAINPGNSGGGLFNTKGELVGIVNAKSTQNNVDGVGYALHSNVVRAIADNIIYYCHNTDKECVYRAILGITVESSAFSTYYDENEGFIKVVEDVEVTLVDDTSIANGVLFAGDIIKRIKVGDMTTEVTKSYHVVDAMLDARSGDTVVFSVLRGDIEMEVGIKISDDCLVVY